MYFQEQRVQQHMFKHGDAVRCGSLWLRYVDANQLGASAAPGPAAAPPGGGTPMMQHPGMGAIPAGGQTGHVAVIGSTPPAGAPPATGAGTPTPLAQQNALAALGLQQHSESDVEIRVLRRRVEQLQTELRVYRAQKFVNPRAGWRISRTISP